MHSTEYGNLLWAKKGKHFLSTDSVEPEKHTFIRRFLMLFEDRTSSSFALLPQDSHVCCSLGVTHPDRLGV